MDEPADIPDKLDELEETNADAHSRQWVAIFISILAVILAITVMGGGNATKDMMNANIIINDTWAFYQAKNIRQNETRLAIDELKALKNSMWLPGETGHWIDERLKNYQAIADRYETDPKTGEGKTELAAKALAEQKIRDRAAAQDPFFDYAEALIQIAIVLASVSMVARRRWVLWLSYFFAAVGVLLTVNAYLLIYELPG